MDNICSGSPKESGCVGSLPRFNIDHDFSPPMQKLNATRISKDYRGIFNVVCDATPLESDFQEGADISQVIWPNCFHSMRFVKVL